MRALTVRQPWASLIMAGAKPYEFRSQRFPIKFTGEEIVIHAAKRRPDFRELSKIIAALHRCHGQAAALCLYKDRAMPVLNSAAIDCLPLGCGLGTVTLEPPITGAEAATNMNRLGDVTGIDLKDYNWAWPVANINKWEVPEYKTGAQGFWHWPEKSNEEQV